MTGDTPPAFVIPLEATAKEIVAAIDQWVVAYGKNQFWAQHQWLSEPTKLWQLFTALRGPDDDDAGLKSQTTAVIRGATCPALARFNGAITTPEPTRAVLRRLANDTIPDVAPHFTQHIRSAAMVLLPYAAQEDVP